MRRQPDLSCKVFCIGTAGVGKTSLILRYTQGFLNKNEYLSTIGTNIEMKKIEAYGLLTKISFMDTAGQERYGAMAKNSFQGTEGIFIVYDCTDEESFTRVNEWIKNYD